MIRPDPDLVAIRDFAELIAASARSARQRERVERAAGVPVAGASLAALRTLARHGPITVSDLSLRIGVDLSTTSRQLKPLDDEHLIKRVSDADDRRATRLIVTAKGRAALARVDAVMLNDFDVALSDWRVTDRHALALLLDRFREDLLRTRTDETGWSVHKS